MANQPTPKNKNSTVRKPAPSRKVSPVSRASRSSSRSSSGNTGTSTQMRIVYIFMLVLIVSGSFLTIFRRSLASQAAVQPAPTRVVSGVGGLSARALTFHRQGGSPAVCDDLTVTASGDAVYTPCKNGVERQYHLSSAERQQLSGWLAALRPVNFESASSTQPGALTESVYLNGRGSTVVGQSDQQALLAFATALDNEITASSK